MDFQPGDIFWEKSLEMIIMFAIAFGSNNYLSN